MSIKKQANKLARNVLAILLTLGVVLFVGFLSFTGALLIYNSLLFAFTAVIFSAGVEGLVYEKNIKQALKKLFKADYFEEVLIKKELKRLLKKNANEENIFLNDYKNQLHYLTQLKHAHAEMHKVNKIKKRLKKMRAYFKAFIKNPQATNTKFNSNLNRMITEKERLAILSSIWWKKMYARLIWIINIAVGLCSALVGISVLKSGITIVLTTLPIVIPATALSMTIFGLAVLGAAGYVFLIHNTLTDMIKNDTLLSLKNKMINWFAYREGEKSSYYALRISSLFLFASIVLGLSIFSTLATAGTWWYAAKAGAHAIPYLKEVATWARNLTVPIMGVTNLLFVVNNSFASVKDIADMSPKIFFNEVQKSIYDCYQKETILEFINPFRAMILLISVPFKCIIFVGHLVSMGVMGNKLGKVPELITTGVNSLSEALTDLHFLLPEKSGHQHADIPTFILNVVLSPLYLLSALWNSLFSTCQPTRSRKIPWQAFKKLTGVAHPIMNKDELQKPRLSASWKTYEQALRQQKKERKKTLILAKNIFFYKELNEHKSRRPMTFFSKAYSVSLPAMNLASIPPRQIEVAKKTR